MLTRITYIFFERTKFRAPSRYKLFTRKNELCFQNGGFSQRDDDYDYLPIVSTIMYIIASLIMENFQQTGLCENIFYIPKRLSIR